jgi:hypothetical protein
MKKIDTGAIWLTMNQACAVSGISPSTMQDFINAGVFKTCKLVIPGKVWGRLLVHREDLLKYMDSLVELEQQGNGGASNETTKA